MSHWMLRIKTLFAPSNKDRWLWLIFIALGIISLSYDIWGGSSKKQFSASDTKSADTLIPYGFVLVPIEIQNLEALSSLTNGFAIVDLFTTQTPEQKSGQLVGRRLRLIQAPLNPNAYAVLVPESESKKILSASGPFVVAIQNRQLEGMGEVSRPQATSRVTYHQEGHL